MSVQFNATRPLLFGKRRHKAETTRTKDRQEKDRHEDVAAENLGDVGFACFTPDGDLALSHAEVAAAMSRLA